MVTFLPSRRVEDGPKMKEQKGSIMQDSGIWNSPPPSRIVELWMPRKIKPSGDPGLKLGTSWLIARADGNLLD
jgi:hypothetical protein